MKWDIKWSSRPPSRVEGPDLETAFISGGFSASDYERIVEIKEVDESTDKLETKVAELFELNIIGVVGDINEKVYRCPCCAATAPWSTSDGQAGVHNFTLVQHRSDCNVANLYSSIRQQARATCS